MVAEDRFLELRAVALVLGGGIGVAGMAADKSWLVYIGIGIVALGGVLAIWRRLKRE